MSKWLTQEAELSSGPKPNTHSGVEGIWIGDLHFSHLPPIARSIEKDWYKAQDRMLSQLWDLKSQYNNTPLFCTGDIFHKALSPNELVNFLLSRLPEMYAIAGNHDLPYHSYDDIRKSAFWTLVESGKVIVIEPNAPMSIGAMMIYGYPYGYEITKPSKTNGLMINVATVHQYCWKDGKGFHNAPNSNHVDKFHKKLKGFDFAFFGDNHKSFKQSYDDMTIVNVGGFQCRNIDEKDHVPSAWLLKSTGKIVRHRFDVSKNVYLENAENDNVQNTITSMDDFVSSLEDTQGVQFDFKNAVEQYIKEHAIKGKLKRELLNAISMGDSHD